MKDAVTTAIVERSSLDRGFSRGVALSILGHLLLFGTAIGATLLRPRQPVLNVMEGFTVPLPPGGGGRSGPPPAPAEAAQAEPRPPAQEPPKPEPPPKIVKPPKEEPKRGLPAPDAKPSKKKAEKPQPAPAGPERGRPQTQASGARGGTGTASQFPGLDMIGPEGPGVPGGTDPMGDWYLAGVQRKIWLIWTQQIKSGFNQPVTVAFTILADGALDPDVRIVQSSGVSLLDLAAKRAVYSAAPFAPLPKDYGTNRFTIQAVFKPTTAP